MGGVGGEVDVDVGAGGEEVGRLEVPAQVAAQLAPLAWGALQEGTVVKSYGEHCSLQGFSWLPVAQLINTSREAVAQLVDDDLEMYSHIRS